MKTETIPPNETPDDRLVEIFNEAAALPPGDERQRFLCEACGEDTVLRTEVDRLLEASGRAGGFMSSGFRPDGPGSVAEKTGDHIGTYTLLEKLGEGGCGIVFRAVQEAPLRRTVALKIIKPGMDTRSVVSRFDTERQALALMEHPGIARVFEAGATASGRPFFAMELVNGVRITEFCAQRSLPIAARLQLFVRVCHAVQHAHQKGVIHRDLKPANILVTEEDDGPVPKVIDFGIAKAIGPQLTEQTIQTQVEQFIGTPAYMSPEQAAGGHVDIDTRSDVYSLGILLYELLTGFTPFDQSRMRAAGLDEMRRIIREVDPPTPSSRLGTVSGEERAALERAHHLEPAKLSKLIAGDLDWIVMKAIEKDRERRYNTANGLALDVLRHLADEPVSATPPGAAYKFRKFARRNRKAIGVAAGIAAVLIAATVISSWQAIRATKAETLAQGRLVEKDAALQDAQALSAFLVKVFNSPDPERDGRDIRVVEVLDAGRKKMEHDLAGQPDRLARLQLTLGSTYHSLGLAREAIALQEKARDYYLSVLGMKGADTLGAMSNLAISYTAAGRHDDALRTEEEVVTACSGVFGPEHPETLRVMTHLAGCYFAVGRPEAALKMQEDVRAASVRVLGLENLHTLAVMSGLAISYAEVGRVKDALTLQEEVRTLTLKVGGPEHPNTLVAMNNLANYYEKDGREEEALDLREEVLKLSLKVIGPEHPLTIHAMGNAALSYHMTGRIDEALEKSEQVLDLSRRVNGREHSDTLKAMINLANTYAAAGRPEDGLKLREDVLAIRRRINGPEHPLTLKVMAHLARNYGVVGHLEEAIARHREVLDIMRRVLSPNDKLFTGTLKNLADIYRQTGQTAEAEAALKELATVEGKVDDTPSPPDPAPKEPAPKEAAPPVPAAKDIKALEKALEDIRESSDAKPADRISAMTALAEAYGADGSGRQAVKLGKEALDLARSELPAGDPQTKAAMKVLSSIYRILDLDAEAGKLEEELRALSNSPPGSE